MLLLLRNQIYAMFTEYLLMNDVIALSSSLNRNVCTVQLFILINKFRHEHYQFILALIPFCLIAFTCYQFVLVTK